jgi:hypothetical protein
VGFGGAVSYVDGGAVALTEPAHTKDSAHVWHRINR